MEQNHIIELREIRPNDVWDYSCEQYNLKGQICLLNTNLWFLLSGPAIILFDFMRMILLAQPLPHYKIF